MNELLIDMCQKAINILHLCFSITPQHLGQIVRDNNMPNAQRKRTRHEHFPKERYKKPIDKQTELDKFYSKVKQFPINKIICLDVL